MAEHPIHNLMKISMENIKQMVDVDTIVGNPVKTENGETIIYKKCYLLGNMNREN